jgi:hypothetical protein
VRRILPILCSKVKNFCVWDGRRKPFCHTVAYGTDEDALGIFYDKRMLSFKAV